MPKKPRHEENPKQETVQGAPSDAHEDNTSGSELPTNSRRRPWVRYVLPAALAGLLLGAAGTYAGIHWGTPPALAAAVNGQPITEKDVYDFLMRTTPGPSALDQLIVDQLVMQQAKKEHITVSTKEVDDMVNKMKANFSSEAQFEQALQGQNLTLTGYREIMQTQVALQKLLTPSIHITKAQEQAYFDQHKSDFSQPEQVKASHILVTTQAEAQSIKNQLDQGANFATLAKEKSLDTGTKDSGGELGYFTAAQMDPNFAKAAFSLKVGQISDPVQSQYGWHIIKVEDIKPAVTPSFASVESKVHDALFNQDINQQAPAYLQKLRSAAHIQTFLPAGAASLPSSQSVAPSGGTTTP